MVGYAPDSTAARFRLTLALFAASVDLRALCGYEHISVPVLTACAAVVVRGRPAGWRLLSRYAFWFVPVGGVAAAAALTTHFGALYLAFGSVEGAVKNTLGNALSRSVLTRDTGGATASFRVYLIGLRGVLAQNKLLTALMGTCGLTLAAWSARRGRLASGPSRVRARTRSPWRARSPSSRPAPGSSS